MATSQHTWSQKTMRYFPTLIRDFLIGRIDKRGQAIQAWQQVRILSTRILHWCMDTFGSYDATLFICWVFSDLKNQFICIFLNL